MSRRAIIISCEHGGHDLPAAYASLFQGHGPTLLSHRGWDLGALELAKAVATALNAPLFATTISRLLIDTNRSAGHRNLFSEISRPLPATEKELLLNLYYHPHRQAIRQAVALAIGSGRPVLHLAMHTFTPVWAGVKRRADLGLLYDSRRAAERQFCQTWQTELQRTSPALLVRRNYPYRGQSDGLATWLRGHYPEAQYLGVEVEINQQLLANHSAALTLAKVLINEMGPNLFFSSLL